MSEPAAKIDAKEQSPREKLIDDIHERHKPHRDIVLLRNVNIDGVFVSNCCIQICSYNVAIEIYMRPYSDFSDTAILIKRSKNLKKDISDVLDLIPTIKYDKVAGFHAKHITRYKDYKNQAAVYDALKHCKNIECLTLGECGVCYETTNTKVNCCKKFLCHQCAGKIKMAFKFKCPFCRTKKTSCVKHYDEDSDEDDEDDE